MAMHQLLLDLEHGHGAALAALVRPQAMARKPLIVDLDIDGSGVKTSYALVKINSALKTSFDTDTSSSMPSGEALFGVDTDDHEAA